MAHTVFLVSSGEYDDYRVLWAFSNRPAAEVAATTVGGRVETFKLMDAARYSRIMFHASVVLGREAQKRGFPEGEHAQTWKHEVLPDKDGKYLEPWARTINKEGDASSYRSFNDAIKKARTVAPKNGFRRKTLEAKEGQ